MKKVAFYIVAAAVAAGLAGCTNDTETMSFSVTGCCENCPVGRLDSVIKTLPHVEDYAIKDEGMNVDITYVAENKGTKNELVSLINEHGYAVEFVSNDGNMDISPARNCDLYACCEAPIVDVPDEPTLEDSLFEDLSMEMLEEIENDMDDELMDIEGDLDMTMENEDMNLEAFDDDFDALIDEDEIDKELKMEASKKEKSGN